MNKRNYQHELDKLIQELETNGEVPTLLLHSCCAPCSSYVLEYLSQYFKSQSCTTTQTFTRKVSTDIAPKSRSVSSAFCL